MSRLLRRFEVLLPLRFNDGESVPEDLIVEALLEIERRFGAVSSESQVIHGRWTVEGQSYRDDLVRVFVDVPDLPENVQFFLDFKERIKARFQQIEIWLTTYLIQVLSPPANRRPPDQIRAPPLNVRTRHSRPAISLISE